MKLRLLKFILSFYVFFFVMEVLREVLRSGEAWDQFLEQFASSIMIGLLSSLLFLLYSLASYLLLFILYKKLEKWIGAVLVVCSAFLIIGLRYLIEEVIIKAVTGFGNYYDGVTASYYIMDNLYYAILYTSFGVCWFFISYASFKEQQQQELLLVNKKAEVSLLKAQLNPHFLFNMLNNIYSLVTMESPKSLMAIEKLSSLLRYSLYESDQKVSISHEVQSVEDYISLQKLRFSEELCLNINVDSKTEKVQVIPFLLLPLVENMFKHGIVNDQSQPAEITVGHSSNQFVEIIVKNAIATREKDKVGGIGIENLRKRLDLVYPDNQLLVETDESNYFSIFNKASIMIKCIVIDDEPLAIELMESHITKTDGIELLASFSNPITALQKIESLQPDVIFSDIQMPELTGVQFKKIIGDKFPLVFTTAYDQYALEGYDLNIVDYLLKPITLKRFQQAVEKISKSSIEVKTDIHEPVQDYIFVKSEYKTLKIDLKDIHYIKGMADYVTLVLNDKKVHTLENLKFYEKTLSSQGFMRVHKSYIVALDKIEYIERNRVILLGDHIPVSETYKKVFFDRVKT